MPSTRIGGARGTLPVIGYRDKLRGPVVVFPFGDRIARVRGSALHNMGEGEAIVIGRQTDRPRVDDQRSVLPPILARHMCMATQDQTRLLLPGTLLDLFGCRGPRAVAVDMIEEIMKIAVRRAVAKQDVVHP